MILARLACVSLSACAFSVASYAQNASARPTNPGSATAQTIELTVPTGTPIQVVLDREVHVSKVGQTIHMRVVQPVYAFDRIVIPVGTEATGQIARIEGVSGKARTLAAMNADFTPGRKIDVEIDALVLPDGKHILVRTVVTPGPGR